MSARDDLSEQPRKKQRLNGPSNNALLTPVIPFGSEEDEVEIDLPLNSEDAAKTQLEQEQKVGISAWSTDAPGFTGIVKKRYTDFLVNEILLNKHVLHLEDIAKPEQRQKKEKTEKKSEGDVPTHGQDEAQAALMAKKEEEKKFKEAKAAEAAVSAQDKEEATAEERKNAAIAALEESDVKMIESIFGQKTARDLITLYGRVASRPGRKARDFQNFQSEIIEDKQKRTDAHIAVRRVFKGLIETMTGDDNSILIKACPISANSQPRQDSRTLGENQPKGKVGWEELGGEYLHFTLYKENKDTMEVLYFIASQLKVAIKNFQFAGTKDRRGVTVQRVAAFRIKAERLQNLNRHLRAARIGGFKYQRHGLELGDLYGNEFTITLRDCTFPDSPSDSAAKLEYARQIAHKALTNFQETGFINYYGLQRFGSFSIGTHEIGMRMLQGNLRGAVEMICAYSPAALEAAQKASKGELDESVKISQDDMARAEALHIWESTGKMGPALDKLPRRFQAENAIIRHLGWVDRKTGEFKRRHDWQGALNGIARNMRLMYVHAYQSLVWNMAAGKRWQEYGNKVVEGDLVLVHEHKDKEIKEEEVPLEDVDEDGEVIIRPVGDDAATTLEEKFDRARALKKEEALSGKYSIFDLVLPLPGFDVIYPSNSLGQFYKDFMGSGQGGNLNPLDMRRKWKDISLSGGYRKIMARPEDVSCEVKTYKADDEQMVQTDLEKLVGEEEANKTRSAAANGLVQEGETADAKPAEDVKMEDSKPAVDDSNEREKIAVVLKMQLGSSQYATMALREMTKGGAVTYKPDFQGAR
ncbi:hypothetical protein AAFC00_000242 [Neodothiora populina]|uniref:TRUD domain-containing protein n=1 Tax=Neodothiora populina TaxID=2781224 RepID=A0ABR3P376_9PEZI